MKKHEYILNIEKNNNIYFSQVVIPQMETPLKIFDKLKKVYIDTDYDRKNWRHIIFKSDIPFYLCLENSGDERYNGICYFNIENMDKVNFYLTSITKKTK